MSNLVNMLLSGGGGVQNAYTHKMEGLPLFCHLLVCVCVWL